MHIQWNYLIGFVLGIGYAVSEYAAAARNGQPQRRVAALIWGAGWAINVVGEQFCHGIAAIVAEAVSLGVLACSLVVRLARPGGAGAR